MQFEASVMNQAIAKAMGDSQIVRFVVQHGSGESLMAFMDENVECRETAQAWVDCIAEQGSDTNGWVIASERAWPDYLNMTSHAARFINWALPRLTPVQILALQNPSAGVRVQLLIAGMLFAAVLPT